jgi:enoyl-CoA hydratase/carnithine racemase
MALGLCLNCDMIVAEEGTKFQITETSRGLPGSWYWALLKYRGAESLAMDAALTGRFFTAEEAFAAKAVDRLAPAGEGLNTARELAATINRNPPLGTRATVRSRRWFMEKLESEVALYYRSLNLTLTEDFAEATRAFVEKRPPGAFKGR